MWTPNRTVASLVAGLVLAGLGGCAVYPLPYAAPYPSPAANVNNVDPARAGQAVYAPVYLGTHGGMTRVDGYANGYAGYVQPGSVPDYAPYSYGYASGPPNAFPADRQGGYPAYAGQIGPMGQPGYGDWQGQVVGVRAIRYQGNPAAGSAAGTAVGGVLGGAIANANSGRWNRGGNTLAGVIAGALIGGAIGTAASYQSVTVAYRVTARMDSGSVRTIDYANPPGVRVGDRVAYDGRQFYH